MTEPGSTALSGIVATAVALVIVLALAWGALRLVKMWQDRSIGSGRVDDRRLRFVRALPVGTRERVMLIEAEGERLLIGVTAGGIALLARWPGGATTPNGETRP